MRHGKHINQFTGVALKDDPTILGQDMGILAVFTCLINDTNTTSGVGWESGNELSGARFGDGPAPADWTKEIGDIVKSLAPNHLFRKPFFTAPGERAKLIQDRFSGRFL